MDEVHLHSPDRRSDRTKVINKMALTKKQHMAAWDATWYWVTEEGLHGGSGFETEEEAEEDIEAWGLRDY